MTILALDLTKDVEKSKQVAERASRLYERDLVAVIHYKPVSPSLIGDFTGETYKLVKNPIDGKYIGAYLTGMPTAQQIIGRTRWLLRVAIATATGAKTHREAEKDIPIIIKDSNRQIRLGAVEFLFGTVRGGNKGNSSGGVPWKGIIKVCVEPHSPRKLTRRRNDIPRDPQDIDLKKIILESRKWFSDNSFYIYNKSWFPKNNKYRPGKDLLGKNRFNMILAINSIIERIGSYNYFFLVKEDEYYLSGKSFNKRYYMRYPISSRNELLDFRLSICIDDVRKYRAINSDVSENIIKAGLYALIIVPTILGLGGGTTRGFGRFMPILEKSIISDHNIYKIIEELTKKKISVKNLLELLYRFIKNAYSKTASPNRKIDLEDLVYDSSIPILPVETLSTLFLDETIPIINNDIVGSLGSIFYAATKMSWKGGNYRLSGRELHTWPLGLPRNGKTIVKPLHVEENCLRRKFIKKARGKSEVRTGYYIVGSKKTTNDCEANISEGRRQSFISAFPLNNNIVVLGFPSGDLRKTIAPSLKYVRFTSGIEINDVTKLGVRKIYENRGIETLSSYFSNKKKYIEFLNITYQNYIHALKSIRGMKSARR